MIPLPLKHYDEAGIVLPPRWFYWLLAIACRDVLLVAAFTAVPAESETLYRLFFPHSDTLWLQMVAALPFMLVVVLLSFREKLWQRQLTGWRYMIRPLCTVGALIQMGVAGYFLARSGWQFDGYLGSVVLLLCALIYMVNRSSHVSIMLHDWRQPPVNPGKQGN